MTTTPTASYAERPATRTTIPPPPPPPPAPVDSDDPAVAILNRKLADLRRQKERIDIAVAVLEEFRAELVNGTTREARRGFA